MLKWFKKVFIPHQHNDYKPHLFREVGAFVLFVLIFSLFALAISGSLILNKINLTALVLPKVLVDYTNENRSTGNFSHLAINPVLEKAAQLKANDMAQKSYFAHTSPEGKSPWYWFKQAGYDFAYAGENLAVNFSDSVDVSKAWMNSPGHRANIMNGNFTEIGIATAEGVYQGRPTVFVVQLFGRPAKKTTTPTTKPVATTTPKTTTPVLVNSPSTLPQVVLSESVAAEVKSDSGVSELYVSAENVSPEEVATTSVDSNYSSLFEKIIVSPNKTLGLVYFILAVLITIVLTLTIFIEIRRQHPRVILLALGLLFIILGLWYIYEFIIISPVAVV